MTKPALLVLRANKLSHEAPLTSVYFSDATGLHLNKHNGLMYQQIVEHFSQMIKTCTLKKGYKLPSIRQLAKTLSVSENTVIEAYGRLVAQGYLVSMRGSGFYVDHG